MINIPQCLYAPSLIKMIDLEISEGCKSYFDLDETTKELITAECMRLIGLDAYNCIIQPDDFSKTLLHLQQFMSTGNMEHGYDTLNYLRKNAVEYFEPVLTQLFDDQFSWRKSA